jgi:DNA-binding NtrC family response regulator
MAILRILIVDDKINFYQDFGKKYRSILDIEPVTDPERGIDLIKKQQFDAVVFDLEFSPNSYEHGLNVLLPQAIKNAKGRFPIIVATSDNRMETRHQAMSIGATTVWSKAEFDTEVHFTQLQKIVAQFKEVKKSSKMHSSAQRDDFICVNPQMQTLKKRLEKLAEPQYKDTAILILGESGVGKEVATQYLHRCKEQGNTPFIGVSLAALNENTIESQLFGHVKGAYTDAKEEKIGYFEACKGGTLFLDEIGEISLELQRKLLRVLETRSFEKMGSTKTLSLDAQLIFATNRNLQTAIEQGAFREDFYQRISSIELEIPALRDRQDEIQVLIEHFFYKICKPGHPYHGREPLSCFSSDMLNLLHYYSWPGNIRELYNVMEKLIFEADAQEYTIIDTNLAPNRLKAVTKSKPLPKEDVEKKNDLEVERSRNVNLPSNWSMDKRTAYQQLSEIEDCLVQYGGRKDDTAKAIGKKSDQHLRYFIQAKYKLFPEIFDNFGTIRVVYKLGKKK